MKSPLLVLNRFVISTPDDGLQMLYFTVVAELVEEEQAQARMLTTKVGREALFIAYISSCKGVAQAYTSEKTIGLDEHRMVLQ